MLVVDDVSKEFVKKIGKKEKVTFLADDGISFKAREGEILGILGPNGAGKTTLLRIISGIMEPTSGKVLVDDMNYQENSIKIRSSIAFLSGNTKLYKDISPMELLRMCGEYYKISDEVMNERIKEIIKRFNMEGFCHQRIETLSTGQYQRVSIARCLVHDPKYYIFDEATSGLDILSSQVILDFIREEKKRGKCILYSTHYMEEAQNLCDNILMINHGRIIMKGTPREILKKTKTGDLREAFFALIKESEEEYE